MFTLPNRRTAARQHLTWLRTFWGLFSIFILLFGMMGGAATPALAAPASSTVYQNPLPIQIPGGGMVESCADPSIIHSQTPGDPNWYMYCTTDPLNGNDKDSNGNFNFHLIPIQRSYDLAHWEYVGDAFQTRPTWVASSAGLWAPDIHYMNGQYYLYFTASDTSLPGGGSAIGVATSASPAGPWVDSGAPVVEPHEAPCCSGSRRWVFDPALITDESGQMWIYYGSYYGGVSVRKLSADGLHSDPASQTQITIANRYEGTFVVRKFGFYYLFASATNCCNGPLTGYSVFVGRATSPLGPFVDRDGVSMLAGRVGGTPVISMNGNRWVGPGHNAVFTDFAGQDWFLYHAVDQTAPYFDGAVGFTRRPVLMDALTWNDGWPSVRNGLWASNTPQPAPAAQPGDHSVAPLPLPAKNAVPGQLFTANSDEFNGPTFSAQWSWVRPPSPSTYRMTGDSFEFDTQATDLYVDSNNASVLLEPGPTGSYLVETKVKLNLPPEGCCYNYVQAGLVIYGDDDNFIKLSSVSIWETRQTEFAKELFPVPDGYPRYGNTVVTAPGDWTYLRIARQVKDAYELYTAYTSQDGVHWNHGGTWTHHLGDSARIGLVSMGGSGFTADFDYVRVYRLNQVVTP